MSGISNEFNAINKIEIAKAIDIVNDMTTKSNSIETRIMENLAKLRKSIILNGQSIDINESIIFQNMQNFKSNSASYCQTFRSINQKYTESVDNAVKYINTQKENI